MLLVHRNKFIVLNLVLEEASDLPMALVVVDHSVEVILSRFLPLLESGLRLVEESDTRVLLAELFDVELDIFLPERCRQVVMEVLCHHLDLGVHSTMGHLAFVTFVNHVGLDLSLIHI